MAGRTTAIFLQLRTQSLGFAQGNLDSACASEASHLKLRGRRCLNFFWWLPSHWVCKLEPSLPIMISRMCLYGLSSLLHEGPGEQKMVRQQEALLTCFSFLLTCVVLLWTPGQPHMMLPCIISGCLCKPGKNLGMCFTTPTSSLAQRVPEVDKLHCKGLSA